MEPKLITFHSESDIPPEIYTLLNKVNVDIYQGNLFCIKMDVKTNKCLKFFLQSKNGKFNSYKHVNDSLLRQKLDGIPTFYDQSKISTFLC